MGLFETIGLFIKLWVIGMVIFVPIFAIKGIISEKKLQNNLKEINKGLNLFDDMNMNSGSCMTCIYRGGDRTKWASKEVVYCSRLNKNVNWIEEDFSREHPCPCFEGDPLLLTKRG